ncbi:SpoIIE family protein phosphatase [Pseudomonas sp. CM25]|uniref:ATP-binding protein n=1 Tax=unclassified Pseudomonas TaxID=196821 RepID=UPI001551AFA0|nr:MULTISPECIES: ATP-binding protein [unclassified Pseudomonas]NQD54479.1 SpoIIE family protein phosphatase [Pseudomonas sp. CM25]NQD78084.1 SpoIIE family protein phosphatase [Pseudomonas sp. CM27]
MNIHATATQVLRLDDPSDVGHARRTAQKLAERHGFEPEEAGRVALVATELCSNVLKHARHGELHMRVLPRKQGAFAIELLTVDRAQGFDAHSCLADGYSTAGTQGIGMGAMVRQAQVFDMYADARGAVVLARLHRTLDRGADLRWGVSQHALHNDPACGDTWHLAIDGQCISALVIDGLGHGPDAEVAAKAGAAAFAEAPYGDPLQLLQAMHQAMSGTRGGATAVAQYDRAHDRLSFTGIGNIGASLVAGAQVRGLASLPGIVGGQFRKAQVFDYAELNGNLLIMYSDGLQSRWNLKDYPGLVHRHPAVITAVLHRDFCRGRDDVTVLAVDLEAAHV